MLGSRNFRCTVIAKFPHDQHDSGSRSYMGLGTGSYPSRRCPTLEGTARLIASCICQLEGAPVKPYTNVELCCRDIITPHQVECLLYFCEIRVGKDFAPDGVIRVPYAVQADYRVLLVEKNGKGLETHS